MNDALNDSSNDANSEPRNEPPNDQGMPLIAHLIELRARLIRCLIAITLLVIPLLIIANPVYEILSEPLRAMLPEGSGMIATDVATPFITPMKLALFSAIFLAMPFILYQIWGFIAPALYQHEKRIAIPLFVSSVLLFYAGIAFAYFVVFPLVFEFITKVAPESITIQTDIDAYLSFVLKIFFAFGLAFEIPIATFLIVMGGITSREALASKRGWVLVGCFILGMLLTPPDVFSQLLLATPMYLLFEIGLLFCTLVKKAPAIEKDELDSHMPTKPVVNENSND